MSLTGKLEDLGLADIFQILSIGKKTGSLLVWGEDIRAGVILKRGLVVKAEADILDGDIGDDLRKAGLIDEAGLQLARNIKADLPEKSIARVLLELGSVSKESIDKIVKKRIEQVVYHLLLLEEGDFSFEPDELELGLPDLKDLGWVVSKGLSPEYLLMEGARTYDETHKFEEVLKEELSEEETGPEWFECSQPEFPREISSLRGLTQELRLPETPSEISLLILRFASDIFQRAVLFIMNDGILTGFGQFGLDLEQADEKVREIALPIEGSPYFSRIVNDGRPFKGELEKEPLTELFISEIGGNWPVEVVFYPIIAENRVVALLYCDNQPQGEPIGETPGLEIFVSQAGLALEKAMLKQKLAERGE